MTACEEERSRTTSSPTATGSTTPRLRKRSFLGMIAGNSASAARTMKLWLCARMTRPRVRRI